MIQLKAIELSAPFRYEARAPIATLIRKGDHVKEIELNEQTGIIKLTTKLGNVVYTSLSNAKAAYADESTETGGNTGGTKEPRAKTKKD